MPPFTWTRKPRRRNEIGHGLLRIASTESPEIVLCTAQADRAGYASANMKSFVACATESAGIPGYVAGDVCRLRTTGRSACALGLGSRSACLRRVLCWLGRSEAGIVGRPLGAHLTAGFGGYFFLLPDGGLRLLTFVRSGQPARWTTASRVGRGGRKVSSGAPLVCSGTPLATNRHDSQHTPGGAADTVVANQRPGRSGPGDGPDPARADS